MKRTIPLLLLVLGVTGAQAADNQPYFGVKAGLMDPDSSGLDAAVNIGGVIGLAVTDLDKSKAGLSGSIAIEGELTITLIDGDVNAGGSNADWDVWTIGGFGVFRSPPSNNLYFKGKLGLVHSDVDSSFGGSDSDTDLALGLGLGYKLAGRSNLEFEITLLDDVNFFSVGYNF